MTVEIHTPRGVVSIFDDPASSARAAAESVAASARAAVAARGKFTLVLAGGETPRRLYELLAQPPLLDEVPWSRTHVFWGDERCVDANDPRSNERMARESLLDLVPIPGHQVHPVGCDGSPAETARRYEALLRGYFDGTPPGPVKAAAPEDPAAGARSTVHGTTGSGPDLVLLGLGENGHTASLFPHATALGEQERWVLEVFVDAAAGAGTSAAGADMWRVTTTAPFINRAAAIVFLVAGVAKTATVKEVIEGPYDADRLPAQLISPAGGDVRWYLDTEAGSLLVR